MSRRQLLLVLLSSALGCIPTVDPDADEWEPPGTTSILMMTKAATTTSAPPTTSTLTTTTTSTTSTTTTTTTTSPCPNTVCPGGWEFYSGTCSCFYILPAAASADPDDRCDMFRPGSHTASIVNDAENEWLTAYIATLMIFDYVYIGGENPNPADTNGWMWSDGSPFGGYTNWLLPPIYPDTMAGDNCMFLRITMGGNGYAKWENNECIFSKHVVCKIPAT